MTQLSLNKNGWLHGARQVASPNYDLRPDPEDVSLIVIHCMSLPEGQYGTGYCEDLFLNQLDFEADPSFADLKDLQVSSHFLINREGEITQFVSTENRAWHAGQSHFQGRANCNDFSIGIELEGTDHSPFTDEQYTILENLILVLRKRYPAMTQDRVVGHSDIAPGRKTDPGACFDWGKI